MFPPIPFSPIRTSLYSAQELMGTLDADDYKSFEHTVDFRCFAYYAEHGRSAPSDPLSSIFEALHDNSITQATLALLKERPRVAAIMGGHDESRGSAVYSGVARISATLCREKFLMASGRAGRDGSSAPGSLLSGRTRRWNTCARVIMQNPDVRPVPESEPAEAWEHDEAGSRIADA